MRNRLVWLIERSRPDKFMTLTANPRLYAEPNEAFRDLNAKFALLIKRLRRDTPDAEFEYLAVWERTQAGWPHLHVLLRAPFIPQRRLSAEWRSLTGAYIVDVRAVDSAPRAARYMAKYLTKGTADPMPVRRWRASSGFLPEPFRPTRDRAVSLGSFKVWRDDLASLLMEWSKSGLDYTLDNEGGARSRPRLDVPLEAYLAHRRRVAFLGDWALSHAPPGTPT